LECGKAYASLSDIDKNEINVIISKNKKEAIVGFYCLFFFKVNSF